MGCEMWDFGLRIAKLGTRPKGGSPKDNLRLRSQKSESRIQKIVRKIEFFFSHDCFLPTPCARRYASFTTDNGPRTTDSSVLPPTSRPAGPLLQPPTLCSMLYALPNPQSPDGAVSIQSRPGGISLIYYIHIYFSDG